jgi:hypothetical protein
MLHVDRVYIVREIGIGKFCETSLHFFYLYLILSLLQLNYFGFGIISQKNHLVFVMPNRKKSPSKSKY